MPAARINWYHLADSAFPTGGYAFSSGLEAAAKLSLFTSTPQFEDFLRASLRQLCFFDLCYLNSCYQHEDRGEVLEGYHASMLSASMAKGSLIQGRSFLRCLEQLEGKAALEKTRKSLPRSPERRYFLLAFAWGLEELGMAQKEARDCFLFINLRDWISSATRLGSIGPMEGHRIQHRLLHEADALLEQTAGLTLHEAARCAPALETAQAWHANIYSKLFQT